MKKPSEFFKSMDELKSFVKHICVQTSMPEDVREDLLFLFGLAENRALTTPVILDGTETLIDRYIAPIITDLNKRGIRTIASCSGLQSEHKESLHPPNCGYLALAFHPDMFHFLSNNLDSSSFTVKDSEAYLKHAVIINVLGNSDEELKEGWNTLWFTIVLRETPLRKEWEQSGTKEKEPATCTGSSGP